MTVARVVGALWRDCVDRLIVLIPETADPVALNGLGRLLWLGAEVPLSDDALAAAAAARCDADVESALIAIRALVDRGLLQWTP
jgi:hypothetical protein